MKILFVYDYYYPAFKAGGVIQSLNNLKRELDSIHIINVLTSNLDLDKIELDKSSYVNNVFYLSKIKLIKFFFNYKNYGYDYVYLNGIYSLFYFIMPLVFFQIFSRRTKIIIAPRGMLQEGAIKIKMKKKMFYIGFLKFILIKKNIKWHATDSQEFRDVCRFFGDQTDCVIVKNIPKKPIQELNYLTKDSTKLKLIFLSLISKKKNLHLILEALNKIKYNLEFDIYGSVKELNYWRLCQNLINNLPSNIIVSYKGPILPIFVQDVIQNYHAFILPSLGENFGHAIYESLSVGRPVIISNYTPWQQLRYLQCGWNMENDIESIILAIDELQNMSQEKYNLYCNSALILSNNYFYKNNFKVEYARLFS